MPRKARRDCRNRVTKKNPMNERVEALKKEIRKKAKEGSSSSSSAAAADSAPAAADTSSQLTTKASAFLSQMRADVKKEDLLAVTKKKAAQKLEG